MLPLLSATDLRLADAQTLSDTSGMRSLDLMERAATAFTDWFCAHYGTTQSVWVFCGRSGNGGDGLVIARLLTKRNYHVRVFVVGKAQDKGAPDFLTNLHRWQQLGQDLSFIASKSQVASLKDLPQSHEYNAKSCIIDALVGYGLSRPLEGVPAALVQALNTWPMRRISVDIPSGMYVDKPLNKGICFQADHVISFQTPKLSFLLPDNQKFVKGFSVVDIGLSKRFMAQVKTPYYMTEAADLRGCLPLRTPHAHKGNAGHGLLIAGKQGLYGAAILAARAAVRTGIGILSVHVPKEATALMHEAVPEALVLADKAHTHFSALLSNKKYQAIAIGPGIGTAFPTAHGLSQLLSAKPNALILDADALNIIAAQPHLAKELPPQSLLTPHVGEFRRLVGDWQNDYDKLNKLRQRARQWHAYIVLKGAYSAVAYPDGQLYFNPSGHAGMATAGSGDVLTGILLGLRAQGMQAGDALRLGVYLHGQAGDIAANTIGERTINASDLIQAIPQAIIEIEGKKPFTQSTLK